MIVLTDVMGKIFYILLKESLIIVFFNLTSNKCTRTNIVDNVKYIFLKLCPVEYIKTLVRCR